MNCTNLEARLSDYLDALLPAVEVEAVEAHLVSCDSCRQLHEDMAAVIGWGRNFPVFRAPEWLVSRIIANTPWSERKTRIERETWMDTFGSIGRWILEPRTAMAVFTATLVFGWISNITGIQPRLGDFRSPTAIYDTAGDLVNEVYDGALRLYYRAPMVTEIQSQIERLREIS